MKMMNNTKMGVYTYTTENGDETYNFNFRTDLSVAEKLRFVNSVVDLVVDETRYNSVIRDLIFDFYIVDIMTDVNTKELKDSLSFLNDVEDFLLSTNIIEIVKANAFPTLFDELNDAVNKSIQYRTGIHPSPLSDALSSLFFALEKKINEIDLDSMMGMAQKFAGMGEDFTMENLVNAYMNSDVHKKNLEEIAEAKKNKVEIAKNLDKAIKKVNAKEKSNKTK